MADQEKHRYGFDDAEDEQAILSVRQRLNGRRHEDEYIRSSPLQLPN